MTNTLLALVALFGVPAALVALLVLAALTVHRRRERPWHAPALTAGPAASEPVARHAWTAAHLAHARITHLEQRIRQLEALSTSTGGDRR